ncbi:MAG: hypothetical protein JSV33_14820 [bacterium]|nr:MAG: hypothetical protein JSV33_14820 [bacterium]
MSDRKHHHVYVIELDKDVLQEPKFATANPDHGPSMDCLYVGSTGLTPEERFENHKTGYKSNRFVKRYGLRLRPLLYEEYNPLSYEDAREMEIELARMLREKGYAVWQK